MTVEMDRWVLGSIPLMCYSCESMVEQRGRKRIRVKYSQKEQAQLAIPLKDRDGKT